MNPEARDLILEQLSRLGATGPRQSMCERCNTGIQRHRCRDCFWGGALCATCLVEQHAEHPLHPIETWVGRHWVRDTLKNLGLRIQLGHGRGGHCIFPVPKAPFFIVNQHGIHAVAVDFCGCGSAVRAFLVLGMSPRKSEVSRAATRVRRKRRGSASPAQERRPNLWPTPFVPAAEQTWRPQRPRSQPIGVESAQRLQAALRSLPAPAEEMWQNTMQDLEQWVKDFPPLDPPLLDSEPANVDRTERAWAAAATTREMGPGFRQDLTDGWNSSVLRGVAGRMDGEGIETGWVTASLAGGTDGEAVVSRWASDQWINVLGMSTRAMREPERREMLDEEYRREVWLQQHREQRRRAWRTTQRVGDLGRARVSAQRDVDVEARRREGWALNFHDLTGMEYIE
ncbi:hypothetical protein DFH09DRAFT_1105922 [Mycena vulgaris]|nr:hypothetical protein DFH09DRAFT_1105922 [Mycena vulgaris]